MDRIFAWVVDRLRWLFLGGALIGCVLVYLGWTDSTHIREVSDNGVEATARVEGATLTKGRRGSESYSLKLSWRDAKGSARTADKVTVSTSFVGPYITGNRIALDTVRIKYLPDAIDTAPIALDDDPAGKMETAELMVMLGIGLAGGGAVGALLMFLLPRRRRDEAAEA